MTHAIVKVKICGVTRADDARAAAAAGADFVGLNFWPRSKRRVEPDGARVLAEAARERPECAVVGVFVDAPLHEVLATAEQVGLDVIQLHGDETPEYCAELVARGKRWLWKAIPVADGDRVDHQALDGWPADALLLDAATPGRGGSGRTIDWHAAALAARSRRVVLAGGLTPANVGEAVRMVRPWAVDVASGVEVSPGVKDPELIRRFVSAARADARGEKSE